MTGHDLNLVSWLSESQRAILREHRIGTVEQLSSLELADSTADVIKINNLRALSRMARRSLGLTDPLERIGAAAGQRPGTPVAYAGGQRYGRDS